ncbi:MAG TPA: hypothetical protein VHT30_05035 [Acidimicrobiales bacterium]|jgi:hypothetical protein|nr:hypothetical protein [Acidimicrobiales bacterium]
MGAGADAQIGTSPVTPGWNNTSEAPLRPLFDERVAKVRAGTWSRLRRSVLASAASSVLSAVSVVVLVIVLLDRRITVAPGVAAAVAIQQLGGRLDSVSTSGANLYEDALFLDDFNSFVKLTLGLEAARPAGAAPEWAGPRQDWRLWRHRR